MVVYLSGQVVGREALAVLNPNRNKECSYSPAVFVLELIPRASCDSLMLTASGTKETRIRSFDLRELCRIRQLDKVDNESDTTSKSKSKHRLVLGFVKLVFRS